ncbi:MAG: BLUF domain-containing protein [Gemmatimonadota bacterium]|nr:BLUF domain-containing protein [Gemmatimonadota bacterium]
MSAPLLFLAYASNASVPFSATALVDLLAVCRRNNARNDVSGMLLYCGGNFLQALEGPQDAVRATLQRISIDPRHSSIDILLEETPQQRIFADWSMAFEEVGGLHLEKHPGASTYLMGDRRSPRSAGANDHDVFEFFASFRENMR